MFFYGVEPPDTWRGIPSCPLASRCTVADSTLAQSGPGPETAFDESVPFRCHPRPRRTCVSDANLAPKSSNMRPLLVTVDQAAALLSIGRTAIYQLVWSGELNPVRIGRSVRFAVDELETFVSAKRG